MYFYKFSKNRVPARLKGGVTSKPRQSILQLKNLWNRFKHRTNFPITENSGNIAMFISKLFLDSIIVGKWIKS